MTAEEKKNIPQEVIERFETKLFIYLLCFVYAAVALMNHYLNLYDWSTFVSCAAVGLFAVVKTGPQTVKRHVVSGMLSWSALLLVTGAVVAFITMAEEKTMIPQVELFFAYLPFIALIFALIVTNYYIKNNRT